MTKLQIYAVRRCLPDNTMVGPSHGSHDAHVTVCGQEVDINWWIIDNSYSGNITCKRCLIVLEGKDDEGS